MAANFGSRSCIRLTSTGDTDLPKRVYDRAHAAVRFWERGLNPLTVTLALRLPPDYIHRDGEPRLARMRSRRVQDHGSYKGGIWSMSYKKWVQSPRLSVHLDWLLRELEPTADAVRPLLVDRIEVDFYCFSSGSATTPPSLPRDIRDRAEALGIKILIDHYGPSPAEPIDKM